MTPYVHMGIVLFFTALGVGVVALFLGIIEGIALARFAPWAFHHGLCVLQQQVELPQLVWPSSGSGTIEMPHGRAKVLGPTECLLRDTTIWSSDPEGGPTFPLKGIIRWQGTQAQLECRWGIAATVFVCACFIGWNVWGVVTLLSRGYLMGALGLLGGWALMAVFYRSELRRTQHWAEVILSEFKSTMAQAAA